MMDPRSAPRAVPQRDNLLGVCHAIGTAFGFDPLWLRVVLVAGVLADFERTLLAYVGAALAVAIARRLAVGSLSHPATRPA